MHSLARESFTIFFIFKHIPISLFLSHCLFSVRYQVNANQIHTTFIITVRLQVWQAIRHQCQLEGDGRAVTREFVCDEIRRITAELVHQKSQSSVEAERLCTSAQILEDLVLKRNFPQFITTYLYEHYKFRNAVL